MGFKNLAFYDLEKQIFMHFTKNDFFHQESLKQFELTSVHKRGLKLLQKHQLLMDVDLVNVPAIQPSRFYKWKSASLITNAIIEISARNGLLEVEQFKKLMALLENVLCKHIVLKIQHFAPPDHVKQLFEITKHSIIHSVQLILPFDEQYDTDDFGTFIIQQAKIKWVIFERSPFKKNLENRIFFCEHTLKPSQQKSKEQFVTNLFLFSESQLHHTYFNRKLFIGENGELKNAPECAEIHGWIQDIKHPFQLRTIIKAASFQKYWYVSKERILVCRDCEFRHMCIDNRVPRKRKDGYWDHEQPCNYDPYAGEWKG